MYNTKKGVLLQKEHFVKISYHFSVVFFFFPQNVFHCSFSGKFFLTVLY